MKREPGLIVVRLSILLDHGFCIEALEEALARYGKQTTFNSDQGSQFTSTAFTAVLLREKIVISMDGKGCWRDNMFVERLWRSVKYEEVYRNAYGPALPTRRSCGLPGRAWPPDTASLRRWQCT